MHPPSKSLGHHGHSLRTLAAPRARAHSSHRDDGGGGGGGSEHGHRARGGGDRRGGQRGAQVQGRCLAVLLHAALDAAARAHAVLINDGIVLLIAAVVHAHAAGGIGVDGDLVDGCSGREVGLADVEAAALRLHNNGIDGWVTVNRLRRALGEHLTHERGGRERGKRAFEVALAAGDAELLPRIRGVCDFVIVGNEAILGCARVAVAVRGAESVRHRANVRPRREDNGALARRDASYREVRANGKGRGHQI
mmetsp:Transcript_11142/g.29140  ORF Transcript_11142/g.29140 Transcript_11142/m.29140 type:complete len:251 (-) Transcript_11142:574-1326(-)